MKEELQTHRAVFDDDLYVFKCDVLVIPEKDVIKTVLSLDVAPFEQLIGIFEQIDKHPIIFFKLFLEHRRNKFCGPILDK
jgi:hypothetical protein